MTDNEKREVVKIFIGELKKLSNILCVTIEERCEVTFLQQFHYGQIRKSMI